MKGGAKENQNPNKKIRTTSFNSILGLGKERDFFVENLSMLISSGMPILTALGSIAAETRSQRMKNIIAHIELDIETGLPLWEALKKSNLFHSHIISLIKVGENSGKLIDNLKVVAIEQEKDRNLHSKLRSAMMYPLFVLSLTAIIGIGISWFILPKLAIVFSQLKIKLPLITKVLIGVGNFLQMYGQYVIPLIIIVLFFLFYFVFLYSKTKFIGQFILFSIPGVNGLIKEIELARFGYLLGILLQAGLPITEALDSVAQVSEVAKYRKLFNHLHESVEDGNSIQKSFNAFKNSKKLIPPSIQQLIVTGEQSGTLSITLLKIGQTFETKADTSTKNMAVILEPVLLVIVWLGVVFVALAVILPIYNLIGGFNGGMSDQSSEKSTIEQTVVPIHEVQNIVTNTEVAQSKPMTLRILQNDLGYLNVRSSSDPDSKKIGKVLSDEVYEYTKEDNGWYEIQLADGKIGWVLGTYTELIK